MDHVIDAMVRLLTTWYHIGPEGAREVIAEMRDTKSLMSLAGYRVAKGAAATSAAHKL